MKRAFPALLVGASMLITASMHSTGLAAVTCGSLTSLSLADATITLAKSNPGRDVYRARW